MKNLSEFLDSVEYFGRLSPTEKSCVDRGLREFAQLVVEGAKKDKCGDDIFSIGLSFRTLAQTFGLPYDRLLH